VSGIDPGSLTIILDGTDVLSHFTIDNTHATWNIGPEDALSEGAHRLDVSIADNSGNSASDTAVFTVDLTPDVPGNYSL